MTDYRQLTQTEIEILENNACWAEDWERVMVAEGFKPYNFHRVVFYGDIRLGEFNKKVEVSKGFVKHSGINDATLRNVTVGNDCLIEKVGNFINNYTIGNDCYISNICTLETTADATYGEGSVISVLNEMGDGNVKLFRELNSQVASFMVKHYNDKQLREEAEGMKIAVMGCIVNGPGEMADADWGYVGEGNHLVSIYKGKEPVLRHVPDTEAVDRLVELIEGKA